MTQRPQELDTAIEEMSRGLPDGKMLLFLRAKQGASESGLYRLVNSEGLWAEASDGRVEAPLADAIHLEEDGDPEDPGHADEVEVLYPDELRRVFSIEELAELVTYRQLRSRRERRIMGRQSKVRTLLLLLGLVVAAATSCSDQLRRAAPNRIAPLDAQAAREGSDPADVSMWLSNESVEIPEVRLTVTIDDRLAVDALVSVNDSPRRFGVDLDVAEYSVVVKARGGAVATRETFSLIDQGDQRWLTITYWPAGNDGPERVVVTVHEQPVIQE